MNEYLYLHSGKKVSQSKVRQIQRQTKRSNTIPKLQYLKVSYFNFCPSVPFGLLRKFVTVCASHLTLFGELLCLKIHISFTPCPDLASLVTFVQYVYSFMGIVANTQTTITIPHEEYKCSHTHFTTLAVWESFPHISFHPPAPSVGEPAFPTATATTHIALELVTEFRPMGCSCIVSAC
jgi:hypothetical protein